MPDSTPDDPSGLDQHLAANPPVTWPELAGDRPDVRGIEIMDGPYKGQIREIEPGWPVPNNFGRREGNQVHWYRVEGDKGCYSHSEEI